MLCLSGPRANSQQARINGLSSGQMGLAHLHFQIILHPTLILIEIDVFTLISACHHVGP